MGRPCAFHECLWRAGWSLTAAHGQTCSRLEPENNGETTSSFFSCMQKKGGKKKRKVMVHPAGNRARGVVQARHIKTEKPEVCGWRLDSAPRQGR